MCCHSEVLVLCSILMTSFLKKKIFMSYALISVKRYSLFYHFRTQVLHDHTLLQNRPLFQAICPGYLWARDKRWLLSRVQRLAGPTWGTEAFCPGWSHQPGQKAPHLSRLVAPPGIKGPFYPGWCYQPGQKAPPRDSSKRSYSIQSHVYYLGELVRKPCAR